MTDAIDWAADSDLFVGWRPPFWMLDYQLQGLFSVVDLARVQAVKKPHLYQDTMHRASEVALVGAVGYFEAFCKHQFAALLSIYPPLLEVFASKRPEAVIRLSVLGNVAEHLEAMIGFALAEQYDFGSAKRINGLFRDLVGVSPISRDEANQFDEILRKRHLIVHHAGIHTLASSRGTPPSPPEPFRDTLVLDAEQYYQVGDFVGQLGVKVAVSSVNGLRLLTGDLEKVQVTKRNAVQLLLQGVHDEIGG